MKAGTLETEDVCHNIGIDRNDTLTGVPSGFARLDEITNGFQKSDLIVVASRPGMGKTSLALNIVCHAVVQKNLNVLYFTQEMNRDTVIKRLKALNDDYEYTSENLVIIDYLHNAMDIMDECQRRKAENSMDLVLIDYFQLLNFCGCSDNHQRSKYLPQYLKQLARTIDCPVIVLSQLNRDLDARECKRPRISDIRDSGYIAEYADLILFLYRDDYYNFEAEEKDICEVTVAKNKNGATGTARLKWIEDYGLFCDE